MNNKKSYEYFFSIEGGIWDRDSSSKNTTIYKGFFFVSAVACELLGYGLSKNVKYIGLEHYRSSIKKMLPANFTDFDSLDVNVNVYLPSQFNSYIGKLLGGKSKFIGLTPNTFFYNFFLGFYIWIIWRIGGGRRLSSVHDPKQYFHGFGFYDLALTPLSFVFYFYYLFGTYIDLFSEREYPDYFYNNQKSLIFGYRFFPRKDKFTLSFYSKFFTFIYIFFLFISFCIFFIPVCVFHIFLRPIIFYIMALFGRFLLFSGSKQLRRTIVDRFWYTLYRRYIVSSLKFFKPKYPDIIDPALIPLPSAFSLISTSFYVLTFNYKEYMYIKFFTYFSIFGFYSFAFTPEQSKRFYSLREAKKMETYKDLILTQAGLLYPSKFGLKSQTFGNVNYTSHLSYKNVVFPTFTGMLKILSTYTESYKFFYAHRFTTSDRTPHLYNAFDNVPEHFKTVYFQFLEFSKVVMSFKQTTLIYSISTFFINFFFKLKNFIFFTFVYFKGFTSVNEFYIYIYSRLPQLYGFLKYFYKNFVIGFFSGYKLVMDRIFHIVFYPVFIIYYEIKYISIFFIDYIKIFSIYSKKFYYFSSIYNYWSTFKNFFIANKFQRFFTREIGEDFEESAYNDINFEDSHLFDTFEDFSAYYDFQFGGYDEYDNGYREEDNDWTIANVDHYFDYWLPHSVESKINSIQQPSLEFFSEDNLSYEERFFSKVIYLWYGSLISPDDFMEPLPYEKDFWDFSYAQKSNLSHSGHWFPQDILNHLETNEDEIEFSDINTYEKTSYMHQIATIPIPEDADRQRFNHFISVYSNKLDRWHSYQVANNFYKIPDALKSVPIPSSHLPVSIEDWSKATLAVSKLFLPKKEHSNYSKKFNNRKINFSDIETVWSRVSYEIDKNPQKLYDFLLDHSQQFDVFKDVVFPKKFAFFNKFNFFERYFNSQQVNLLQFFSDYFSINNVTDQSVLSKNLGYRFGKNKLDVLYGYYFFISRANYDFDGFYKKLLVLISTNQFKELGHVFNAIPYYNPGLYENEAEKKLNDFDLVCRANFVYYYLPNRWPTLPDDEKVAKAPILSFGNFFRSLPFKVVIEFGVKRFFPKFHDRFINRLNKRIDFDLYTTKKDPGVLESLEFYSNPDFNDSETGVYESYFSLFSENSFLYRKVKRTPKLFNYINGVFFREPTKSTNLIEAFLDGEDLQIDLTERQIDAYRERKRTYFHFDQLIEGDLWSSLNPSFDDFFYEVYYLNNLFFPSSFSHEFFEELFPDDTATSSTDIYDEYIAISTPPHEVVAEGEGEELEQDEYYDFYAEDPDTLDYPDELFADYDVIDPLTEYDADRSDVTFLGNEEYEAPEDDLWYVDPSFWLKEHLDNDEGIEEWEFDEFDSFYDVDISINRLFFGGLKNGSDLPAIDKRLFFGPLSTGKNLDIDLDYASDLKIAKNNANSKDLQPFYFGSDTEPALKDEIKPLAFSFTKLSFIYFFKFLVYILYYVDSVLVSVYFIQGYDFNLIKKISFYRHYAKYHEEYNSFIDYKDKLENWIEFFETFIKPGEYERYKSISAITHTSEPEIKSPFTNSYGKYWFQYPNNTYFRDFAFYTNFRFSKRYLFLAEDADIDFKDGKSFFTREKYIDNLPNYDSDKVFGLEDDIDDPGFRIDPRTGIAIKRSLFRDDEDNYLYKFYADHPLESDVSWVYDNGRQNFDRLFAYPWFFTDDRQTGVGSDFTYLDLDFIESLPTEYDWSDYDQWNYSSQEEFIYNLISDDEEFNNKFQKNIVTSDHSYTAMANHEGYDIEEEDWDIGTLITYSNDDANSHVDEFSEKYDIFVNAVKDLVELFYDYFFYYFQSKFRKYVTSYYKYWEIKSENYWLDFAARYGIWVLIFRNIFSLAMFLTFFIYGFFALSRIFYIYFGEYFVYYFYNLLILSVSTVFFIYLARFIFKPANDFYKSTSGTDKFEFVLFIFVFWYGYILKGYHDTVTLPWYIKAERRLRSAPNIIPQQGNFKDWGHKKNFYQHPYELGGRRGYLWKANTAGPLHKARYYPRRKTIGAVHLKRDRNRIVGYGNIPNAYYVRIITPKIIYNFFVQHYFKTRTRRTTIVGYRRYRKKAVPTVRQANTKTLALLFHRPERVNWQHTVSEFSDNYVKNTVINQTYAGLLYKGPYGYKKKTNDRRKSRKIVYANYINERPFTLAPFTTRSKRRAHHPYDVRPKFSTNHPEYFYFKFNSSLYNSFRNLDFNKGVVQQLDEIPAARRSDLHFPLDITKDATKKSVQQNIYGNSLYRGLRSNLSNTFKAPDFYEKSLKDYWVRSQLIERNFMLKYSNVFRKYIFYYNPLQNQSMRELYGLSLRDVYPNPEINSLDINILFGNPKKMTKRQKKLLIAFYKIENFESAKLLIAKSKEPDVKLDRYPYYNTNLKSRIREGDNFYENFFDIISKAWDKNYNVKYKKKRKKVVVPHGFDFKYHYQSFKHGFSNYLRDKKINIGEITDFYEKYIETLRSESINDFDEASDYDQPLKDYLHRIANVNRALRARLLAEHFKLVKFMNKISTKDYVRESISYIKPYSFKKRFYMDSAYYSFANGLPKRTNLENKIYDSFINAPTKKDSYLSKMDDRVSIQSANKEYFRPFYISDRRSLLYNRRGDIIDEKETAHWFGEYQVIDLKATWWNIFLDIIFVRDLVTNSEIPDDIPTDNVFPYKYKSWEFRDDDVDLDAFPLSYSFPYINSKSRIINRAANLGNKMIGPDGKSPSFVAKYIEHQNKRGPKTVLRNWEYPAMRGYEFEPLEQVAYYLHREKVGTKTRPEVRRNRLNFKKSHFYTRIRHKSWVDFAKSPQLVRDRRKRIFTGINATRGKGKFFRKSVLFKKKWRSMHVNLRKRFIFNVYTFIGLKKRINVQFPTKKYGVPHNQVLQNRLYLSSQDNERYLDEFTTVMARRRPHRLRRYFGKEPMYFRNNNDNFEHLMDETYEEDGPLKNYAYSFRSIKGAKISDGEVDEEADVDLIKNENEEIKKQKDYYIDLQEELEEFSEIYSDNKDKSGFELQGLVELTAEKDSDVEVSKIAGKEIFDPVRGDADTLLLRAKRRQALLELRRQREEGKIKYIVIEDNEDEEAKNSKKR
jgi:hypothetical protein